MYLWLCNQAQVHSPLHSESKHASNHASGGACKQSCKWWSMQAIMQVVEHASNHASGGACKQSCKWWSVQAIMQVVEHASNHAGGGAGKQPCKLWSNHILLPVTLNTSVSGLACRWCRWSGRLTMKGFFFTPGFLRIACRVAKVCFSTCSGQMSTLVTTKNTGTFNARATPICSLHIPTMPVGWAECLGTRTDQHAETDPKQPKKCAVT